MTFFPPAWRLGVVQEVAPPGVLDLGPGYPGPDLQPVGLVRHAYARALEEFGSAALAYGDNAGALPLREALARRAHLPDAGRVVLTAGTSQALHLLGTTLAAPGRTVVTDRLGYDYGRAILTSCGLRLAHVPADVDGMDPGALDDALAAQDTAFVYLNPTFHNPTGQVVPERRRREILEVTARRGVLVVEDDAYAELGLSAAAFPPPLAELDPDGVIRLGTFSKTIGPGLRLGWLTAGPAVVTRLLSHGLFHSGGSLNHLASLAVATMITGGEYDRHLDRVRDELRVRRDALLGALGDLDVTTPHGGFFLWLRFGPEQGEEELMAAAAAAGVRVAAGSRFGAGQAPRIRLSYSLNRPAELASAGRALHTAWARSGLLHERISS
ncbi:aminotransferase class I/II-fold pyridoxal phosphate-dependent enzyme [Lentzea sp. NBC_00516]|uniref:aminotransferase class I/II-fold pyridoxal phosphate-dependent enzyme n=1 Tax=Lentzea sp. NBC_00516 TaxID=2903582 RepID=UPI002E808B1D|nr:aminotransferase class I/II-fold pyridoxal phosphate-dependent enzyme [Lentzea sp. NBC_00516]WUD28471.1 aminotransferase class I/II-fold pyridoxal phosphate-dependent enzyme [Lentzea sp. NBC_00516]